MTIEYSIHYAIPVMINSDRLLSNAYYYNHITQHLLKGLWKPVRIIHC